MGDLCDKGSESSETINSESSQHSQTTNITTTITPIDREINRGDSSDSPQLKTCVDCGTTKTPLWRGGPAGPKSLCNACGIRSRKRRRALLGLNKDDKKTKKPASNPKNKNPNNNKGYESTSSTSDGTSVKYEDKLESKLFSFVRSDVKFQRPRSKSNNNHQRRKLGEVEQAAFLLMALSCGSVYS